MKHLSEEQLVLYHYGEGGGRAAAEEHLAACQVCRSESQALRTVLAAVSAQPVPERAEDYGRAVYARLRARLLEQPPEPRWSWADLFATRRWVSAAALAGLLGAAFLAGRFWPREAAPASAALPAQVREHILLVAVGDHLDRSQMVLIELANAPKAGNQTVDISTERQWARELVPDNRLYRQTAARAGEMGLASVLDELERVLLDIAHSPSQISPREMEGIRRRIEDRGLLFKVRVIGSTVREREKAPPRETVRGTL